MGKRILLTVAYDGTNFHGWQLQPGCRTVEGVLNETLSALLDENIEVIGASRTDSGVHARGNLAVFDTESRIPGEKFAYALNQKLPADVKIQDSREAEEDFHPRHCNSIKTYEYRIYNAKFPSPLEDRYSYFTYIILDEKKMNKAGKYLIGTHDFKSFCSVHTQAESTVRTIYSLDVLRQDRNITIRITGNGFLYNMVRIIAGTLMEVGMGKYPPEYVAQMLLATNRCAAGPTAPPQGLTLCEIKLG